MPIKDRFSHPSLSIYWSITRYQLANLLQCSLKRRYTRTPTSTSHEYLLGWLRVEKGIAKSSISIQKIKYPLEDIKDDALTYRSHINNYKTTFPTSMVGTHKYRVSVLDASFAQVLLLGELLLSVSIFCTLLTSLAGIRFHICIIILFTVPNVREIINK